MVDAACGQRVVGTCGITSKVGGFEHFYAYRIPRTTIASEMLNVCKEIQTLTLVEEHRRPVRDRLAFFTSGLPARRQRPVAVAGALSVHGRAPAALRNPGDRGNARRDSTTRAVRTSGMPSGKHFFEIDFPKPTTCRWVNKKFIAASCRGIRSNVPLLPLAAQAVHRAGASGHAFRRSRCWNPRVEVTDMVDIFRGQEPRVCERPALTRFVTIRESRRVVVAEIAARAFCALRWRHILNPGADSARCAGRWMCLRPERRDWSAPPPKPCT